MSDHIVAKTSRERAFEALKAHPGLPFTFMSGPWTELGKLAIGNIFEADSIPSLNWALQSRIFVLLKKQRVSTVTCLRISDGKTNQLSQATKARLIDLKQMADDNERLLKENDWMSRLVHDRRLDCDDLIQHERALERKAIWDELQKRVHIWKEVGDPRAAPMALLVEEARRLLWQRGGISPPPIPPDVLASANERLREACMAVLEVMSKGFTPAFARDAAEKLRKALERKP